MAKTKTEYTWLDESATLIVVRCNACPYWHGFAMDRTEFYDVAVRHEAAVHPGIDHAQEARAHYRARRRAG